MGTAASLVAFGLIAVTDYYHGELARAWNQISDFGKFWDPLADKLLVVAMLVALSYLGVLVCPWGWLFTAVTLFREVLVSAVRWAKARHGRKLVIPANWNGKLKMVLQVAGIVAAIIAAAWPPAAWAAWALLVSSLYFSAVSAMDYMRA